MKIIAHRCGPTIYPEQTMTSARLALKNGADYVEIDVRYSKDKIIVCSHDANTQRVFGADAQRIRKEADKMARMSSGKPKKRH